MPFEVPETWEWTTVGEISKSILYGVSESAKTIGKYKLLRITDIQDNCVNWNTVPFTDYNENKAQDYLLNEGDILFARTGATVGKSYLVKEIKEKSIYASYLIRVQTYNVFLPEYVKYFFESGFYWEQIRIGAVGVGQPNVNGTILGKLNIPIPPIEEQKRIVAELSQWLNLIDIIENGKESLKTSVQQAKAKILDLAIHGKLVPQNPADEPASDLLRRINPKAEITSDNAQYGKVPQGWCQCAIKDIGNFESGYAFSSDDYKLVGVPLVRISNITNNGTIDLSSCVYICDYDIPKFLVHKGDLLIAMSGATTGKMGVYQYDMDALLNQRVGNLKCSDAWYDQYRNYFMYAKSEYILKIAYGGAQPNISAKAILNIKIDLPPIKEQHRIVSKIEQLFAQLDLIEAEL